MDHILEMLKNGEWQELKEISDRTGLEERKIERITNFLVEFNFLELKKKEKKIKLSSQLTLFLKKIEEIDGEDATAETPFL